MTCETHGEELVWIKVGSKSVLRCQTCHDGTDRQREHNLHGVPRVKFAENFWRDRPYNAKELGTPYGKSRYRRD